MNKIIMIVPHYSEQIYTKTMLSLMNQLQYCHQIMVPSSGSKSLAVIREGLAEKALEDKECTHLLWLDGDELFPKDMIPRLLEHDKDIVGAWTIIRQDPSVINAYKMVSEYKHTPFLGSGLCEVDRIGFGSVLIKREVFEKLPSRGFLLTNIDILKIFGFVIKPEKMVLKSSLTMI